MNLDVLTPRGQQSVKHERRAIEIFSRRYPSFEIRMTPKNQPSDADGMMYERGGELKAIIETKCRGMPREQFEGEFGSEWLITADKLDRCRRLAVSLRVAFYGLLYLIPDDVLLVQRIYNVDGSPATAIRTDRTRTQATCNGGSAVRLNAYVLVQQKAAPVIAAPPVPQREAMPISKADHSAWVAEYERHEAALA